MALFNRKTLKFIYPEIVKALFDGWNDPKDVSKYDQNLLFNGTATSSKWGQALSFYYGLDFVSDDFVNKLAIAVEYTSEKSPQLILSGNSKSTNWVTVNPSTTQLNGSTNIAYFTLNDMVSAYKKALSDYDSYGQVLPGLQSILVGDQGANLTVTKVYKIYVQKLEETVKDAAINNTNKTLYLDSTTDLSVTLPEELQKAVDAKLSTCTISYKSSDDKVAKVSETGKITGTGIGTTTITTTVTVGESTKSFTTTVEVKNAVYLLGDVNGDNEITMADCIALKRYLTNPNYMINEKNADINGDGQVDVSDLLDLYDLV
jgi:hypothetical protein